jgi:hypothetical protein
MSAARIPTTLLPREGRRTSRLLPAAAARAQHEKVFEAYEAGEYPSVTRGSDISAGLATSAGARSTTGRQRLFLHLSVDPGNFGKHDNALDWAGRIAAGPVAAQPQVGCGISAVLSTVEIEKLPALKCSAPIGSTRGPPGMTPPPWGDAPFPTARSRERRLAAC